MSDFFNSGWSIFIAVATRRQPASPAWRCSSSPAGARPMADDNTTGHVWDEDLREMNNPLPRWWMWLFVLTVVFALGLLWAVSRAGQLRRAARLDQPRRSRRRAGARRAGRWRQVYAAYAQPAGRGAGQRRARRWRSASACSSTTAPTCHGSDARGSKGFPNLTDSDWLYGGTPEKIEETITKGRIGMMPPMAAAVGSAEDVRNVANYVLSLSGSPHNAIAAAAGRAKFVVCAACHGADGKGNQALGAPNLTDKVWLHGWGEDAIVAMVNNGKTNVMPAQAGRLTRGADPRAGEPTSGACRRRGRPRRAEPGAPDAMTRSGRRDEPRGHPDRADSERLTSLYVEQAKI